MLKKSSHNMCTGKTFRYVHRAVKNVIQRRKISCSTCPEKKKTCV